MASWFLRTAAQYASSSGLPFEIACTAARAPSIAVMIPTDARGSCVAAASPTATQFSPAGYSSLDAAATTTLGTGSKGSFKAQELINRVRQTCVIKPDIERI